MRYVQCAFRQGHNLTLGYIEDRLAESGFVGELKGRSGVWELDEVFGPAFEVPKARRRQAEGPRLATVTRLY